MVGTVRDYDNPNDVYYALHGVPAPYVGALNGYTPPSQNPDVTNNGEPVGHNYTPEEAAARTTQGRQGEGTADMIFNGKETLGPDGVSRIGYGAPVKGSFDQSRAHALVENTRDAIERLKDVAAAETQLRSSRGELVGQGGAAYPVTVDERLDKEGNPVPGTGIINASGLRLPGSGILLNKQQVQDILNPQTARNSSLTNDPILKWAQQPLYQLNPPKGDTASAPEPTKSASASGKPETTSDPKLKNIAIDMLRVTSDTTQFFPSVMGAAGFPVLNKEDANKINNLNDVADQLNAARRTVYDPLNGIGQPHYAAAKLYIDILEKINNGDKVDQKLFNTLTSVQQQILITYAKYIKSKYSSNGSFGAPQRKQPKTNKKPAHATGFMSIFNDVKNDTKKPKVKQTVKVESVLKPKYVTSTTDGSVWGDILNRPAKKPVTTKKKPVVKKQMSAWEQVMGRR
jgi:hypothetical protein